MQNFTKKLYRYHLPHELALVRRWRYIQMEDRFIEQHIGLSTYNVREHNDDFPPQTIDEKITWYFGDSTAGAAADVWNESLDSNFDGFWESPTVNWPIPETTKASYCSDSDDAWTDISTWDASDKDEEENMQEEFDGEGSEEDDVQYGPQVIGAQEECGSSLEVNNNDIGMCTEECKHQEQMKATKEYESDVSEDIGYDDAGYEADNDASAEENSTENHFPNGLPLFLIDNALLIIAPEMRPGRRWIITTNENLEAIEMFDIYDDNGDEFLCDDRGSQIYAAVVSDPEAPMYCYVSEHHRYGRENPRSRTRAHG